MFFFGDIYECVVDVFVVLYGLFLVLFLIGFIDVGSVVLGFIDYLCEMVFFELIVVFDNDVLLDYCVCCFVIFFD